MLQGVQVLHITLVTAEDLGSGAEIIGKVFSIPLPHLVITTQGVDPLVEGNVVRWPVTCGTHRQREKEEFLKCPIVKPIVEKTDQRSAVTQAQTVCLVRVLHQPRDLLHHGQGAVINTVAQLHFAPVHYHILVVVGAYSCSWNVVGRRKVVQK